LGPWLGPDLDASASLKHLSLSLSLSWPGWLASRAGFAAPGERRFAPVVGGWAVLALFVGLSVGLVGAGSALAAGDVNEAACPNEALVGFEEYLPDCRGYEMVTPPFKDGTLVVPLVVSGDGSRLIGESDESFAGGVGRNQPSNLSASYEFERVGSGWAASGINPPASLFPTQALIGWSADLKQTLWGVHSASQSVRAEELYVRESDGSLVKVGPMVPPSAAAGPVGGNWNAFEGNGAYAAGESDDLSHVFFYIETSSHDLWPGDTTGEEERKHSSGLEEGLSLYEYVGRENVRPELVGVNNEGHLISGCGTYLGAKTAAPDVVDDYNAVSADGETVFFTSAECYSDPPVNELHARIGQSETVAISEPSGSDCGQCQTAVKASAVFRGASEDGSKVFFTTGQELLPGDVRGNLYEYDFDNPKGHRIVRVTGSSEPEVLGVARVSADGSHVYFVAGGVLTGANADGNQPMSGAPNLYVYEQDAAYPAGRVAFIATLSSEDSEDWREEDRRPVQATPDGRFFVFDSVADLTPGDASSQEQVFEYDAQQEKLVRVSVAASGYTAGVPSAEANGSHIEVQNFAGEEGAFPIKAAYAPAAHRSLAVSADGSMVVFVSRAGLTPGSEDGVRSVYEYRSSGGIANGNVYLISGGTGASGAREPSMSASGEDVFFETLAAVLPVDSDTQWDVYDARAGGGVAASAAGGCVGEACRGALAVQPSFGAPGSGGVQGGGGVAVAPVGVAPAAPRPSGGVVAPRVSRAQKLAQALRACKGKRGRARRVCETDARKRYGAKAKSRGRAAR
jgi:hypothetical protein